MCREHVVVVEDEEKNLFICKVALKSQYPFSSILLAVFKHLVSYAGKIFKGQSSQPPSFSLKFIPEIYPWPMSVAGSSQCSLRFTHRKLFASQNVQCPHAIHIFRREHTCTFRQLFVNYLAKLLYFMLFLRSNYNYVRLTYCSIAADLINTIFFPPPSTLYWDEKS